MSPNLNLLLVILLGICTNKVLLDDNEEQTEISEMDMKKLTWNTHCKLQKNENSCLNFGRETRYFYDVLLEDCTSFVYGGCPHTYNIFPSLMACYDNCNTQGPAPAPVNLTYNVICRMQPVFGDCFQYHPMFYFDVSAKLCKGFSYSGCGGNLNRFPNMETCTLQCAEYSDI